MKEVNDKPNSSDKSDVKTLKRQRKQAKDSDSKEENAAHVKDNAGHYQSNNN